MCPANDFGRQFDILYNHVNDDEEFLGDEADFKGTSRNLRECYEKCTFSAALPAGRLPCLFGLLPGNRENLELPLTDILCFSQAKKALELVSLGVNGTQELHWAQIVSDFIVHKE
jgi:hypothetical protein